MEKVFPDLGLPCEKQSSFRSKRNLQNRSVKKNENRPFSFKKGFVDVRKGWILAKITALSHKNDTVNITALWKIMPNYEWKDAFSSSAVFLLLCIILVWCYHQRQQLENIRVDPDSRCNLDSSSDLTIILDLWIGIGFFTQNPHRDPVESSEVLLFLGFWKIQVRTSPSLLNRCPQRYSVKTYKWIGPLWPCTFWPVCGLSGLRIKEPGGEQVPHYKNSRLNGAKMVSHCHQSLRDDSIFSTSITAHAANILYPHCWPDMDRFRFFLSRLFPSR